MPFCKCYPKRNLRGIGRAAKPFFGGCPISLRFEMTTNTKQGGFENLNHRSIYFLDRPQRMEAKAGTLESP